jgi:Flp pilus assembly protein TadG
MRLRFLQGAKSDEQGGTLVEFSMVAFLFVVVLLGVVEMARMVLVYTALNDAARAGVRYAIVHGSDSSASVAACSPCTDALATTVQNFASTGLVRGSNVTTVLTLPDSATKPGSRVDVKVSYRYDPLVSWFSSKLNVSMGATSEGVIVF